MAREDPRMQELARRYKAKFGEQFKEEPKGPRIQTATYKQFKREMLPKHQSYYEKGCNICDRLLTVTVKKDRYEALTEQIKISHLDVTPNGVEVFSFFFPSLIVILGATLSMLLFDSLFFAAFFVFVGFALVLPLRSLPEFFSNAWRMKASNQMVQCVFYVVTYMRHTSNLEGAINFAADHLTPPLSLDLKKIVWDVETGEYDTIKDSLDAYLETWKKWNGEFIESMHLIESSLYEASEERRLALLDKSLDVILTETYERMLHYAHNLKSPITILHMLGVILPILGLVVLPLIVSFIGETEWYHIAALYNVVLPMGVFILGRKILSLRPTGYGDVDISEVNPKLRKYRNVIIKAFGKEIPINPLFFSIGILTLCLMIAFVPIMLFYTMDDDALIAERELGADEKGRGGWGLKFLDYKISAASEGPKVNTIVGPYGIGASILSLFIPLGFGLAVGLYLHFRTKNLIKIREKTKQLEKEFASALFQLGSRLGDGIPLELAMGRVAANMEGSVSGKFFLVASDNITQLGMNVHDAIFDSQNGAILYFPSNVIDSSMRVLLESIKKGPAVASEAMLNVSRYIKEIHRVDERLKDLMADIISSMRSQIDFMAPSISGIVIGITSMITTILGKLRQQSAALATAEGGGGRLTLFTTLFGDGIPTYYFQFVVGLYVLQIVYILSIMSNGIENGADKLSERYIVGKNFIKCTILYCSIALIVMIIFNSIAVQVVTKTASAGLTG
ncbi:hypothetical protein HY641_02295 [Candidatus Woesearchaeota archaeon]|nr:hypothetical protein [Candidatus Woesearchaeota archaeon]